MAARRYSSWKHFCRRSTTRSRSSRWTTFCTMRGSRCSIFFYPQQMQQLAEQIGFGPESDEEICALFDCLTETFDRETAGSRYVQYCFTQTLPEGVQAVFYVTVERVTGFVLPQFEWASEGNGEGVGESFPEEFPEVSEQSYRLLNQTMRSIVLYQGVSEQDILQNTPRYQRYETAREFWNSVC